MPTGLPITNTILEYLALTAVALVVATFLVTRIFYVRRIAKCQTQNRALQHEIVDLRGKMIQQTDVRKAEPVQTGRGQQIVAIIAAIGGLSALVAATAPIAHDLLQGQYTQCEAQLKSSKEVLNFDPNLWKAALAVPVSTNAVTRKEVINLGQNVVHNSNRDSFSVKFDGTSPAIIDSDRSVTIILTLDRPSTGVRLLVRPIRPQETAK
jgi:hypothetical protein